MPSSRADASTVTTRGSTNASAKHSATEPMTGSKTSWGPASGAGTHRGAASTSGGLPKSGGGGAPASVAGVPRSTMDPGPEGASGVPSTTDEKHPAVRRNTAKLCRRVIEGRRSKKRGKPSARPTQSQWVSMDSGNGTQGCIRSS